MPAGIPGGRRTLQGFLLHPDDENVLHTRYRSAVAWALSEELERSGVKPVLELIVEDPVFRRLDYAPNHFDDTLRVVLSGAKELECRDFDYREYDVLKGRSLVVSDGDHVYDIRGRLPRRDLYGYATDLHNAPWDVSTTLPMIAVAVPPSLVRSRLWTARDDLALPLARSLADRILGQENPWPAFGARGLRE